MKKIPYVLLSWSLLISSCEIETLLESKPSEVNFDTQSKNSPSNARVVTCDLNNGIDNQGYPIGGGGSYPAVTSGDYPVSNLNELKTALNSAQSGETIFISPTAVITINSPSDFNLTIKAGVTLASYRGGTSNGALIKVTTGNDGATSFNENYVFAFGGENARLTGIRFEGPSSTDTTYLTKCVTSDGWNNITIDNNEFYNWARMAIGIGINPGGNRYSAKGIVVRNNYIHDNKGTGWGYGVMVAGHHGIHPNGENPFALIKGNLFERNRHDVTSSGLRGSGYEASYNTCLGGNTSANFDVHGGKDSNWVGDDEFIAGTFIHIHHNTFDSTGINVLIRGIPTYMALINNNSFRSDLKQAIIQGSEQNSTEKISYLGHVFAWNNAFGYSNYFEYRGLYVSRDTLNFGNIPAYNTAGWLDRDGNGYKDFEVMGCAFGDFDGNCKTEILKIVNGYWYTTEIPEPESSQQGISSKTWSVKNYAPGKTFADLVFKDFNGNGTDIFKTNLTDWHISSGGTSSWQLINHAPGYALSQLRFGDFNGDEKTDVFRSDGGFWYISFSGQTSWCNPGPCPYKTMESSATVGNLAFGDFNDDGKTDVFKISGSNWFYSDSSATNWVPLATGNGGTINNLIFIDINNNGQTDILTLDPNSGFYKVSWAGTTAWGWFTASCPTLINVWD